MSAAENVPSAWADLPGVDTVEDVEAFGRPDPIARDKVQRALGEVHREFIGATPLVFVATASPDGRCDVSPKGDPPGFVHVLDDHTLAIPERSGNRRMDGFHDIVDNPHVGLIFVIPGRADTLRVNGSARLVTEAPFFDDMVVRSHRPALAVLVGVEEVFFHCPKAFVRAHAWKPKAWRPGDVRSYAQIAKTLWRRDESLDEIEARLAPSVIDTQLYPPGEDKQ